MTTRARELVDDINSLPTSAVILAMGYTNQPSEELRLLVNDSISDEQRHYSIEEFALTGSISDQKSILRRIFFEVYVYAKLQVQQVGAENTFYHYLSLGMIVKFVDYKDEDLCLLVESKHGHNLYMWSQYILAALQIVQRWEYCHTHYGISEALLAENTTERQILTEYAIARVGADYTQAKSDTTRRSSIERRENTTFDSRKTAQYDKAEANLPF